MLKPIIQQMHQGSRITRHRSSALNEVLIRQPASLIPLGAHPHRDARLARNQKRLMRRNEDLVRTEVVAEATREQFSLLRTYLDSRHAGGGMSDMGLFDYVAMVEETPVDTQIIEYRRPGQNGAPGPLIACALTDTLRDGLSMVYSFFHPGEDDRSLGTYMILDHIGEAKGRELPHVYLGYWVEGSEKMAYKTRFKPMQALGRDGWQRI